MGEDDFDGEREDSDEDRCEAESVPFSERPIFQAYVSQVLYC